MLCEVSIAYFTRDENSLCLKASLLRLNCQGIPQAAHILLVHAEQLAPVDNGRGMIQGKQRQAIDRRVPRAVHIADGGFIPCQRAQGYVAQRHQGTGSDQIDFLHQKRQEKGNFLLGRRAVAHAPGRAPRRRGES